MAFASSLINIFTVVQWIFVQKQLSPSPPQVLGSEIKRFKIFLGVERVTKNLQCVRITPAKPSHDISLENLFKPLIHIINLSTPSLKFDTHATCQFSVSAPNKSVARFNFIRRLDWRRNSSQTYDWWDLFLTPDYLEAFFKWEGGDKLFFGDI